MAGALTAGRDPMGTDRVTRALAVVRARIAAAGGDPHRVKVLAVTKGFGRSAVEAAAAVGLRDVGESYAQELVAKAAGDEPGGVTAEHPEPAGVRWHFIGRLQRNKVKALAPWVSCWQSLDRPELAAEIARRAPGASVLVQVNVSAEAQKGGVPPAEVEPLVAEAGALGLDVRGLMAIGAPGGAEAARPGFSLLATLAQELGLPERSMGMTGDLEAAVAEGSTMVRVGTALFGPRPGAVGQPPRR